MIRTWLGTSWEESALVVVSTIAVFASVIVYIRMAGLRSLAKMSSFDFAMTIAVGSLIGSTASSSSVTLANGLLAIAVLFLAQVVIATGRRRVGLGKVVDNQPIVLMIGTEMLDENLRRTRLTRDDLWAKIRQANVLDPSTIQAVVMETTGDVSVLHGDTPLHPDVLSGVEDAHRVH